MEENITISFDEQCSPRTADDILFDLSALKDSDSDIHTEKVGDELIMTHTVTKDEDQLVLSHTVTKDEDEDQLVVLNGNSNEITGHITDETEPEVNKVNDGAIKDAVDLTQPITFESDNSSKDVEIMNNNNVNVSIEDKSATILEEQVLSNPDIGDNKTDLNLDKGLDKAVQNFDKGLCNDLERDETVTRPSTDFSDVLAMNNADTTNTDEFTAIADQLDMDGNNGSNNEIEGEEDINLENIIMQEKQQDSDSGSEFDFDIPAVKPTPQPDAVQTPKPVVQEMKDTPRNEKPAEIKILITDPDRVSHVIKEEKETPSEEIQAEPVQSGNTRVLEAAKNEWDKVNTIQAGFVDKDRTGVEPTIVATLTPMSPYELTQILKTEDYSTVKSNIKTSVDRKGFAAFVNFLFGPPKLKRPLLQDKERIFCIAATPLQNENTSHIRTLQTIYRTLTGSKFDCARFGAHWEEIGFQGNDPGTDLRSVGILGLVNLLFLLKNPKTHMLASDIYRLSLHPTQNFPFCLMGINMTRITLQVLREDVLNKECNRRGEVLEVVSEFYAGMYLLLYQVWKGQGKTISDSGFVIKDLEMKARKNTAEIFKNLDEYLNKKTKIITELASGKEAENLEFINVCDNT